MESVPAKIIPNVGRSHPSALCDHGCSSRIEARFEKTLAHAAHMTDYTVQFLLMELESVGNIRLEEGSPSDRWCAAWIPLIHAPACAGPPEVVFVLSPTGSLPVVISCCPASVRRTSGFTASLGLRSIESSASATVL